MTDEQPQRTVTGRRRRPSTSSSGSRERAEAPTRDDREAPPPRQPGGAPPTAAPTGGQRPNLLMLLIGAGILLLLMFFGGSSFLNQEGGEQMVEQLQNEALQPEQSSAELAESLDALVAQTSQEDGESAAASEGQTWTVMLYQDADDKILEQDIYIDFNESERIGSTDQVRIVAQVDRYNAGYSGDGNWSSTRRYFVTQDGDLERAGSVSADVGEVNMSDGATLVDFVMWSVENYPADKYVLILSDHGMGWPGGWSDPDPKGPVDQSIPLQAALGDELYLNELDAALDEIRDLTSIDKFELIGMDACLMSHIEVYSALAPHARYAVASQETEPAVGWAYTAFLRDLVANPDVSGHELAQHIVDSYIDEDQRVVDDNARAAFLNRGSPFSAVPSADQLARQLIDNVTLSAVDLAQIPSLINSLNDFSFTLSSVDQSGVAKARNYAQSFTSIFGSQVPPSYIDIAHFASLAAQATGDSNVEEAASQLAAAVDSAVIAEMHGPKRPGATGISIYFPNSQLYQSPAAGPISYTAIADRFAQETVWDDFLAYHYTGRRFEPAARQAAVPERTTTVAAPGAGAISVSPVQLSGDVAAPGQPVTLSADITGDNIGYIYLQAGFHDAAANSLYVIDMDYIDSGDTREIDGVFYPDWGEGDFTLEFEWEPIVFYISDGENAELALLRPQSYGVSPDSANYTVDGIYTYADDEQRAARLYFSDGELRSVFGFANDDGTGAPREITPQVGDSFTIIERWLDLDASGAVIGSAAEAGGTLIFRGEPFVWQELDAPVGEFVVGYIVVDLDGNATQSFATVDVQ